MSGSEQQKVQVIRSGGGSRVEAFTVSVNWVKESGGLRLDASHYNPRLARALSRLQATGMDLRPLGDLVKRVVIPPRVRRTYVEEAHGVPFLQGSHVVHFQPPDLKFVSRTRQSKLDELIIHEGWVLVTRSGSVGRVCITPPAWDGWAASEHILRIIPYENAERCPTGYLAAFLQSPEGQAQLTSQIYGAVVDELTEDQTKSVLVPVPTTDAQARRMCEINELAAASVARRQRAMVLADEARAAVGSFIMNHDI